jgi:hypothetical protein
MTFFVLPISSQRSRHQHKKPVCQLSYNRRNGEGALPTRDILKESSDMWNLIIQGLSADMKLLT